MPLTIRLVLLHISACLVFSFALMLVTSCGVVRCSVVFQHAPYVVMLRCLALCVVLFWSLVFCSVLLCLVLFRSLLEGAARLVVGNGTNCPLHVCSEIDLQRPAAADTNSTRFLRSAPQPQAAHCGRIPWERRGCRSFVFVLPSLLFARSREPLSGFSEVPKGASAAVGHRLGRHLGRIGSASSLFAMVRTVRRFVSNAAGDRQGETLSVGEPRLAVATCGCPLRLLLGLRCRRAITEEQNAAGVLKPSMPLHLHLRLAFHATTYDHAVEPGRSQWR